MPKDNYIIVGELKIVDGVKYFKRGHYDDGMAFGYIYKNEEAYEKDWGEICYIPEAGYDEEELDKDGFAEAPGGYSHYDLLELCCGNREWCDYLFEQLKWACPETYLNEWCDVELADFYTFIKPDAKVWWNDPDNGLSSGEYTVYKAPFAFDENGDLVDSEAFSSDIPILIGDGISEVEVPYYELTPIYPNLKGNDK